MKNTDSTTSPTYRSAIDFEQLAFPTVSWALMHYRMHRAAAEARAKTTKTSADTVSSASLWEPQVPYRIPALPGREGNTNVWFNPAKGGLVFDDSWLRRSMEG